MFVWFRNSSIAAKLLFAFGVMIMGYCAGGYFAWDAMQKSESLNEMALKAQGLRNYMSSARLALCQIIIRHSFHNLNGDTDQADRSDISECTEKTYKCIQELQDNLRDDPDAVQLLSKLEKLVRQSSTTRDTEQLPALARNQVEGVAHSSVGEERSRFATIRNMASELEEHCQKRAQQCGERATILIVALGGLMAFLAVILFVTLNGTIARPLRRLTASADQLALGNTDIEFESSEALDEVGLMLRSFASMGQSWKSMAEMSRRVADGDLNITLTPRSDRDVFVESFNVLVAGMAAITGQFRDAVQIVRDTSNEILISVNQSAVGATETATAANETSAIVEEVRQTSHVASQKAKQVSESAQKTAQITAAGRKATEDIIEGMNKIREQVDLIAEAMVRLSEKSQSISSIIATVDDLAKQSNLLAVNASIEAARAGELGRGFGVVAQEVKNMAEQSKQSTAQVRAIIAEIQQATNAAAMATELGGKAVDAALQQSGRAGESIAVLAGSVLESAQAAAQIAVSNQQQLAGVDQVASAMSSIRDACDEHIVAIKHVENAANRLSQIGGKLKSLVDRYEIWSGLGLEGGARSEQRSTSDS